MLSLKRKGQIGGLIIVAAILITAAIAAFGIQRVRLGGTLAGSVQQMSDFNADILPPPLYIVEPYLEATLIAENPAGAGVHRERLRQLEAEYRKRLAIWQGSDLSDALKGELVTRAGAEADRFWAELDQTLLPAAQRGDLDTVKRSHDRLGAIYARHEAAIHDLVEHAAKQTEAVNSSAASTVASTLWLLGILITGVVGLLGFGLVYLMGKALNPLAETAETMNRMGEGDLEAGRRSEHRADEIGQMTRAIEVFRSAAIAQRESEQKQKAVVEELSGALEQLADGDLVHRIDRPLAPEYETLRTTYNGTLERLADLMQRVTASASSVSTGAAEIRAASDDLALRNEQQAASLEETAAAMNQVTGIVGETAKGAVEVQKSITEAHHEATEGGDVVRRAIEGMAAIERSSQEITQIINVIDGIAFQTNLLALNAGVEAARAGDAGKGFAVVANEVRALAQRSADAAKDIKALITASTEQVAGGVQLVGETGALLEKIVTRVGDISTLVGEIARSTESQSANLQQVNSAVGDMDRMTQQNAAMVEESTAAARSLAEEAGELTQLVSQFRAGGTVVVAPVTHARRPAKRAVMPRVSGNLALKSGGDDDWAEF